MKTIKSLALSALATAALLVSAQAEPVLLKARLQAPATVTGAKAGKVVPVSIPVMGEWAEIVSTNRYGKLIFDRPYLAPIQGVEVTFKVSDIEGTRSPSKTGVSGADGLAWSQYRPPVSFKDWFVKHKKSTYTVRFSGHATVADYYHPFGVRLVSPVGEIIVTK